MTSVVDIVVMGRSSMTSSSRWGRACGWPFITTFHVQTCLATMPRTEAPHGPASGTAGAAATP